MDKIDKFCVLDNVKSKEELHRIALEYIDYYHKRANFYKYAYRVFSIIKYLALAAIPIIQVTPIAGKSPWVVVIASSVSLLMDSLNDLFQMKDKWILYRNADGRLMREQRQYNLKSGAYSGLDDEKRFHMFADNFEDIVQCEAKEWAVTVNQVKERRKDSSAAESGDK